MKIIALVIACSGVSPGFLESITGNDYPKACEMIKNDRSKIVAVANTFEVNPELMQCIVFPEYIRYNTVQGLIEEKSLEIFYVESGSDQVDFSIGRFQIKPGFAESLEKMIETNDQLKLKYARLLNRDKSGKEVRAIRIARLKSVYWQSVYVAAFIDVCHQRYNLSEFNFEEKIRFIATVYNNGWMEIEKIESAFDYPFFPYGKRASKGINYWEVAMDYYLKSKSGS